VKPAVFRLAILDEFFVFRFVLSHVDGVFTTERFEEVYHFGVNLIGPIDAWSDFVRYEFLRCRAGCGRVPAVTIGMMGNLYQNDFRWQWKCGWASSDNACGCMGVLAHDNREAGRAVEGRGGRKMENGDESLGVAV